MNLREPKKKHRVKLQPRPPLPVTIGKNNEWMIYTAHLTDFGSCVVNPDEMSAVHSKGFFGKGSLSRSYPSFGKERYGAPPVTRHRQWLCRQKWLSEVKKFNDDANVNDDNDGNDKIKNDPKVTRLSECDNDNVLETELENSTYEIVNTPSNEEPEESSIKLVDSETDKNIEIIEVKSLPQKKHEIIHVDTKERVQVDEITLDSTEEDDMCMVINKDTNKQLNMNENNSNIEEMEIYYNTDESNDKRVNINDTNIQRKLLILPDSDSDTEDYLKDVKPRIENEGFPVRETLHLTAEETFFLLYGLGCLQVVNFDGTFLDINSAWHYFCKQKHFVQKYVVYHYFRSKGWVVKPGLKYGGDFLLYKKGPPFYHASYIVIIDVIDADSLIRDKSKSTRQITWNNLLGWERLSETAAKEILFAQVLWPSSISRDSTSLTPDILSEFTVRELLWRRWVPKQTRDVVKLEEDDEDSY